MQPENIKQIIETQLPGSTAIVSSPDNVHYSAMVISELFINKSKLQQQQLVNQAIQKYITDGSIHALSLKTFTPEAWEANKTAS